jgi:hypothetical protein
MSKMENEEKVTWANVTEDVNLSDYEGQGTSEITQSHNEEPAVESDNDVMDRVWSALDTGGDSDGAIEVLEIDGKEYAYEDVLGWKKDADNKSSWSKSNTEKAQNIAKVGKLAEVINSDSDFKQHIEDYFVENRETLDQLGLDSLKSLEDNTDTNMSFEEQPMDDPRLVDMQNQIEELAIDKKVDFLDNQLSSLESNNPEILGGDKTLDFLKYVDAKGTTDLDGAFKEWSYPKIQSQLKHYQGLNKNKAKNRGRVINTSNVGAKGESNVSPIKKWNQISMENPDIKKYFE